MFYRLLGKGFNKSEGILGFEAPFFVLLVSLLFYFIFFEPGGGRILYK